MTRFWKLMVYRSGDPSAHFVIGAEEALRINYNEICAAMNAVDGTGPKTVQLSGYCDSADRAIMETTIVVESIEAVTLQDLY